MFYKLLGMFVWKASKLYLSTKMPKRRAAGLAGLLVLALAALAVSTRKTADGAPQ